MIGWNWTGQQKGERKVIMPTNAVGQETVSANFCLALPCSLILSNLLENDNEENNNKDNNIDNKDKDQEGNR